tara:strand:+ start:757 stop:1575 length:819 start_codon:yes stop_codon:yes gene_type:complete
MVIKSKKSIKTSCFCINKKIIQNILRYNSKPLGETDFRIKKKEYKRSYSKCNNCDHYFSNHNYDLEKLYRMNYSKLTYGSQQKIFYIFRKVLNLPKSKSDNKFRIKRVMKIVKKNFVCLDVGSGLGVFPYELKKNKIKVHCLEKDKNLNKHLKKMKLDVVNNSIFLKKNSSKYDLITMNKIIEHIENPKLFLSKFLNILKKPGYLYIEVPSTSALKSKLGKRSEEFFIEHFHIFSKKSLKNLLNFINLKIIYVKDIKENSGKYTLLALAKKI